MTTTVRTDARPAARTSARAGWLLAAAQFGYAAWFAVCVWVALARAAHFAGHLYVPSQGDPYTAGADVWTGWSSGFEAPIMFTATTQPFVTLLSIGASAWLLAQQRIRSRKVVFALLLASALLMVAAFVLASTPAGRSVHGWILD